MKVALFSFTLALLVAGGLFPGRVSSSPPPENERVADAVEQFILQFSGGTTCFGNKIKLGNPTIFRKELRQVKITPKSGGNPQHVEYARGALGGILPAPPNELRLPFDPLTAKLTQANRLAMYHESLHQIESLRGVKLDNSHARAERNTNYMSEVAGALGTWAVFEKQIVTGEPPIEPAEALARYQELEAAFRAAQTTWGPDRELEVWAGVYAKFEYLQSYYLSGECGPQLKALAERAHAPGPQVAGTWTRVDVRRIDTPPDQDQLSRRRWFSEASFHDTVFTARLGGLTGAWGGSATMTWTVPAKVVLPGEKIAITMSARAANTKENFIEGIVSAAMSGNPVEDSSSRLNAAEWVMPPPSADPVRVTVWSRVVLHPGGISSIFGQEHVTFTYRYQP